LEEFACAVGHYASGGVIYFSVFPALFFAVVLHVPEDNDAVARGVAEAFIGVFGVGDQFARGGVDAVAKPDALGGVVTVFLFVNSYFGLLAGMFYTIGAHDGIGSAVFAVLCHSRTQEKGCQQEDGYLFHGNSMYIDKGLYQ
jgi:hypothetical protein